MTFVARQLLDCAAPSNFIATNPVAQRVTLASGGWNLVHGAVRAAADTRRALSGSAGAVSFRPGYEVALTPGKVVRRNRLTELLRYDPATPSMHALPLLIVPAGQGQ